MSARSYSLAVIGAVVGERLIVCFMKILCHYTQQHSLRHDRRESCAFLSRIRDGEECVGVLSHLYDGHGSFNCHFCLLHYMAVLLETALPNSIGCNERELRNNCVLYHESNSPIIRGGTKYLFLIFHSFQCLSFLECENEAFLVSNLLVQWEEYVTVELVQYILELLFFVQFPPCSWFVVVYESLFCPIERINQELQFSQWRWNSELVIHCNFTWKCDLKLWNLR